ncbi:MAG: adenine nucleotide alpha hydrolase family protein [Oscillospiraceae bacterium]|jgi:tRNA(Ile)-lysidine synthase TilS/MesJ|nr:adenine nucleotide alpha hydrolase family protein [Oscillospiraceae bacterium]
MQKLIGLVRRCVQDYHMINEGDRIGVGVSGGKDSVALLAFLAELRKYNDKAFDVEAITIDMGLGMDYSPMAELCDKLDVKYNLVHTEIGPIIFDHRKEKNPCSMCAKMRRGALNQAILDRGMNKLALGHHYDDAVETFMMSLIYEGRISCFQPVTDLDRTGIIQIRPMLYIHEKSIDSFVTRNQLPVITNRCPVDKYTKREEIKQLVYDLSATYPDLKERIFGAMQRFPLPEWEPKGRYKRPKDQE